MLKKPNRSDEDFSDEIQAHIEIEADRLVAEGMDRADALAAARRAFGMSPRAASAVPARKAGSVSPLDALRSE